MRFNFYFKANAVTGKEATLTLTNTNGDNPSHAGNIDCTVVVDT